MIRSIFAALLCVTLALSATATPALADKRDVAKIVGGLAALYLLKEALERDRERSRSRSEAVTRAPVHQPRNYTHRHGHFGTHSHRNGTDHARAHPRRHTAPHTSPRATVRPPRNTFEHLRPNRGRDVRLLPGNCFVTHRTRDGLVSGYGARCMQNSVARPGILPPACISRLQTRDGPRNIYRDRCLQRDGWSPRTARR